VGADGPGEGRAGLYLSDPRRSKPEKLKTVLLGDIEG
jgi:hypothetical protein